MAPSASVATTRPVRGDFSTVISILHLVDRAANDWADFDSAAADYLRVGRSGRRPIPSGREKNLEQWLANAKNATVSKAKHRHEA